MCVYISLISWDKDRNIISNRFLVQVKYIIKEYDSKRVIITICTDRKRTRQCLTTYR